MRLRREKSTIGPVGSEASWAILAGELAAARLWDHLPATAREFAQSRTAAGAYPLGSDDLAGQVEFFADGEELAEGGVQDFLKEITPGLTRWGLTLDVQVTSDPYEAGADIDYVLDINGVQCTVWTREEIESDDLWYQATIRPLKVINRLLAGIGTDARVFTLHTGANDGMALILNRVPAAMQASALFKDRDIPSIAE
jgi:hypothetical protein